MDAACREAHRKALADPDDDARRAAYAEALLRIGHRVCAAFEFATGHDPRAYTLDFKDRAGNAWTLRSPDDVCQRVAPPDLPDGRVPRAILEREEREIALVLLAVVCLDCIDGRRECADCNGRGSDRAHFPGSKTGPCPECHGSGMRPCESCAGSAILLDRIATTSPCAHDALAPDFEHDSARPYWTWKLLRCRTCGLAVLEWKDGSRRAACPACGRFGCAGH